MSTTVRLATCYDVTGTLEISAAKYCETLPPKEKKDIQQVSHLVYMCNVGMVDLSFFVPRRFTLVLTY